MDIRLPFSRKSVADDTTRRYWGDAARGKRVSDYPVNWLQSDLVLEFCVNPRISGDPQTGWLEWIRKKFVPQPLEKGLVLGCSGGALERKAARLGICNSFHGVDISPDGVEVAEILARREGYNFTYEIGDANQLQLEDQSYDIILADMSLHHISRLEFVLGQFCKGLRPGGLLVLNEFTGPDCFQWTDRQLKLATSAIRSLPLSLRWNRDITRWKRYLKPWTFRAKRWTPEKLKSIDPSEAVRSSEILHLTAEYFDFLALRPYGGTIMSLALNNIVGNFTRNPRDLEILENLAREEDFQMEELGLPSDYHVIVGKKA
jgi:2-polyprenyl-3-methyl-5-hydroxy-6-metoxy-1,4-benzoquinol methylase